MIENILVLNQKKLLDNLIELFNDIELFNQQDFLNFVEIENKQYDKVDEYIEFVKNKLKEKKIINWDMFISLMNLETTFLYKKKQTKTLFYLVDKKSIGLLKFLFLITNKYDNLINLSSSITNNYYKEFNIIHYITLNMFDQDNLIFLIFCSNNKYIKNMIELKDNNNNTPIYYVVSRSSEYLIKELISINVIQLDWLDNFSNSLIHWSIKKNYISLLEFLILNGSNLENINKSNRKPIHLACIKNNYLATKLLIENDVDLEAIDCYSNKPIDYAIKYSDSCLVNMLLKKNIEFKTNIFEDVVNYQTNDIVDYFLGLDENNQEQISYLFETNFFLTNLKLLSKNYFYQAYKYSIIKINLSVKNFLENLEDYYIDGRML